MAFLSKKKAMFTTQETTREKFASAFAFFPNIQLRISAHLFE